MNKEKFFTIPVTEVIKNRTSVRTFAKKQLPAEIKLQLENFSKTITGPFNNELRFHFFDNQAFSEKTGGKIGTYGVIKGASYFTAGIIAKDDNHLEQFGYIFEKYILFAHSLGLGTCWLGGTFRRKDFEKATEIKDNELLPIITPVGYPANKKSFIDSAMKLMAGSKNRKPWSDLFFAQTLDKPLSKEEAGAFATPLEMVRLAPSASNKQPWRIIKDGNSWHFLMAATPKYNKALGFEIQRIDMGIAMCHFEMTAKEEGLEGNWDLNRKLPTIPKVEGLDYIATWKE